jgi:hypothetical protein
MLLLLLLLLAHDALRATHCEVHSVGAFAAVVGNTTQSVLLNMKGSVA